MNFLEYRKAMKEFNIPKFKFDKNSNADLKDKINFVLNDTRQTEYSVVFYYKMFWPIAVGYIPVKVIERCYDRIGKECFTRLLSFDALKSSDIYNDTVDLYGITCVQDLKFYNLKDFIIFYDELAKFYFHDLKIDVDETYSKIVKAAFDECKLTRTSNDWIKRHYPTLKFRPKLSYKVNKSENEQVDIRELLNEFDNAVNPFLNKELQLDDIGECTKRVDISANFSSLKIGNWDNYTEYSFEPDKINYKFKKDVNEPGKKIYCIEIGHTIRKPSKYDTKYSKSGEILEIHKYAEDYDDCEFLDVNLTTGEVSNKRRKVTKEDMLEMVSELKTAIATINENNISKMVKPEEKKTLKLSHQ